MDDYTRKQLGGICVCLLIVSFAEPLRPALLNGVLAGVSVAVLWVVIWPSAVEQVASASRTIRRKLQRGDRH